MTAQAGAFREALATTTDLPAFCYTASVRRAHLSHRLAVVGRSAAELAERLAAFEEGDSGLGISAGETPSGYSGRRLVFVFSGHGSQWPGMARRLLAEDPSFRAAMAWCDGHLKPHLGWSVLEHLDSGEGLPSGPRTQELIFALQVALTRRWRSLGVQPAAVVGHSMGEVAGAYAAGVLSIEDAARLIHVRAGIQERLVGNGAMGVVGLPESQARAAIDEAGHGERLWVAISNSARTTVLSGDPEALAEVLATLKRRNVFTRRIDAAGAGHCPLVEPLDRELVARLDWLRPAPTAVPLYSSVAGGPLPGEAFDAAYWGRNLREQVRFSTAVRALANDGHGAFVEISPDPLLLGAIEQDLRELGTDALLVPSLRRETDEFTVMLGTLGALHASGHELDWSRLYPDGGRVVPLPSYPWQHRRHWLPEPERRPEAAQRPGGHPLLLRAIGAAGSGTLMSEALLDEATLEHLSAGTLWNTRAVPAAAWLEMALAAGRERFLDGPLTLSEVRFGEPLLSPDPGTTAQLTLSGDRFTVRTGPGELRAEGRLAPMGPHELDAQAVPSEEPGGTDLDPAAVTAWLTASGVGLAGLRVTGARREGHCTLRLSQEPGGSVATPWLLPPAVLETALRAPALASGESLPGAGPGPLPRFVERLVLARPVQPGQPLTIIATAAQVCVLDPEGSLVASLTGVELRPPAGAPLPEQTRQRLSQVLYTQRWEPRPRQRHAASLPARGAWLLLADRGGVGVQLAELLAARGESAVVVTQDDAAGPDGLEKLVHETLRGPGCRGAVHLWALDLPTDAVTVTGAATYDSVLRLARTLGSTSTARPTWYVTRGGCAVETPAMAGPTDVDAPAQAPMWSMAGVAAMEHPVAWGGLLDLDPLVPAPAPAVEAAAVLAELLSPDGEDHVALRAGRRYVPRVARDRVTEVAPEPFRCSPEGTYLVAEAGALGPRIARWLVDRGARHVVLAGRDAAGGESADLPSQVRGVSCDTTEVDALDGLLTTIAREGGGLRGVVWLAVDWELGDSEAVGQRELADATRERAHGAWLLDERCAALGLDPELFVVFSGVASGWGSLGVARQAPADALLAALAHRRRARGRPAMCVRWAPWDEEGLLSDRTRSMLVRAGLEPLAPRRRSRRWTISWRRATGPRRRCARWTGASCCRCTGRRAGPVRLAERRRRPGRRGGGRPACRPARGARRRGAPRHPGRRGVGGDRHRARSRIGR
ncbi:hypothetical protein Psuf_005110 [Phytohabitans suffuscus]|uniref:Malonyl-CoA:ACP transacylase (MAT) domain-containing protein n=1 Tax=Phytohabitans suffuscus TaxID=624315 RepID=A0A6F8YB38_9ACTN|nr:hypothetical protein Psuf_005110 [Phytohabitans suffuscus]